MTINYCYLVVLLQINDRISLAGLFWLSRKENGRVGLLLSQLSSTLIGLTFLLVEEDFQSFFPCELEQFVIDLDLILDDVVFVVVDCYVFIQFLLDKLSA